MGLIGSTDQADFLCGAVAAASICC